jgi:predicted amidophosphoribosyltransferase
MKYEGERDRAAYLGVVLAASITGDILRQADVVVPVPMYAGKRRERGYNQAAIMAKTSCTRLGVAPPVQLVIQHDSRPSQVGLSAEERRRNVHGSFSPNPDVTIAAGARIAIVDDVRTTGATVAACVEALRPFRPRRIDVVTLAVELPAKMMELLGPGL